MIKTDVMYKILKDSCGLGWVKEDSIIYNASRAKGEKGMLEVFRRNENVSVELALLLQRTCISRRHKHDPWEMLVLKEGLYEDGYDSFSSASRAYKIPAGSISQSCSRARMLIRNHWSNDSLAEFINKRFV